MTQVRFMIGTDRAGRARKDADAVLKPLNDALVAKGFSVVMTLKGLYSIVCTTDKDTFEKTFSVKLTPGNQAVLNNWTVSGPLVIPQDLRDLGATTADIDQQRAVLRFP